VTRENHHHHQVGRPARNCPYEVTELDDETSNHKDHARKLSILGLEGYAPNDCTLEDQYFNRSSMKFETIILDLERTG